MKEIDTDEQRFLDVLTFTIGCCDHLRDDLGFVEGGTHRLSPEGKKRYKELKAEGFKPSKDELRLAMAILQEKAEKGGE